MTNFHPEQFFLFSWDIRPLKKGYILYDLSSKTFLVNRNATFQEDIYHFKHIKQIINLVFLVLEFIPDAIDNLVHPLTVPPSVRQSPPKTSVDVNEDDHCHVRNTTEVPTTSENTVVDPLSSHKLRKFSRSNRPPIWLQYYVVHSKGSKCAYPISAHVSYSHVSPSYSQVLSAYSICTEPQTFLEADRNPQWVETMKLEIATLEYNHTWSVMDLPPGKKLIGCRWIFKITHKASGEIERFKATLVAKGYSQREGLDYSKTFSPVAKMVTVRSIIVLAASKQ
uniref:Reverse transcriptase Ty1/copia-type domain-containing protein n=1 Tax=Nicotiana tabacum TaxID=4097 RepID=A0A1S4CZG4_TOBAC|nr:PREDICTED: uncharacterized protein LOC107824298 [Nicotiana tabacum]